MGAGPQWVQKSPGFGFQKFWFFKILHRSAGSKRRVDNFNQGRKRDNMCPEACMGMACLEYCNLFWYHEHVDNAQRDMYLVTGINDGKIIHSNSRRIARNFGKFVKTGE